MADYHFHIVSERLLFRKTFAKLIALFDSAFHCHEHADGCMTFDSVPGPAEGAVLIDCGAHSTDQLVDCVLHVLSIQAEATVVLAIDEQDDALIDAGMNLGVMGVIIKASPPQLIIDSLQRIINGERCRPAPVVAVARDDIPEHLRRQLSARQQKMLRAIMGGQSISSTARQLSITSAKLVSEMRQVIATLRGRPF